MGQWHIRIIVENKVWPILHNYPPFIWKDKNISYFSNMFDFFQNFRTFDPSWPYSKVKSVILTFNLNSYCNPWLASIFQIRPPMTLYDLEAFSRITRNIQKNLSLWLINQWKIKNTVIFYTAEPPNSHTYPNSHTLFGLKKMWLFGDAGDIRRIRSLIFFSRRANHFLLFLKNCVIQDWIETLLVPKQSQSTTQNVTIWRLYSN